MPTLTEIVRAVFGSAVLGSHNSCGDETVLVDRDHLQAVASFLRDDPRASIDVLVDVTAVDFADFPAQLRQSCSPIDAGHASGLRAETLPRYEVVYHLLSMALKHRLRVKVPLSEDDLQLPTLCDLWIAANWGEREVYDMYGVHFTGHPDLRRVLMYDEFEGHPLRKDYPLRGYQPLAALPTLADYTDHEVYR